MKRILSAMEARRRFGEVIEGVHYRGDEVVIERAGKAMAVIIPKERYDAMERSRQRVLEFMEANWEHNKNVSADEIEQEIAEAIREVRAQQAVTPSGS